MIRERTTIEYKRCDSCGGPSNNPDVAELVTIGIGINQYALQSLTLCHPCIERELLPLVAPWATRWLPHAYVAPRPPIRTCMVCGRGPNTGIHR